jgi:predicted transcriptional regulator
LLIGNFVSWLDGLPESNYVAINMTQNEFLEKIEAFLAKHRMTPTVFSREATGDPAFVLKLRKGRDPRLRTVSQVEAYMDEKDKPSLMAAE